MTHSLVIIASSTVSIFPVFPYRFRRFSIWSRLPSFHEPSNSRLALHIIWLVLKLKAIILFSRFAFYLSKLDRCGGFFFSFLENIFPVPIIILQLGKKKQKKESAGDHLGWILTYTTLIANEYRIFSGYSIVSASIHCSGPHAYTYKHHILHMRTYAHVQM